MARLIVTVDEFLRLPSDVETALKADLNETFSLQVAAAQSAATSAASAAVDAELYAAQATAPVDGVVQDVLTSMGLPTRQAADVASISVSSSQHGTRTVTFQADHFQETPVVVATTDNADYIVAVENLSVSGMRLRVRHRAGSSATTTVNVMWMAVDKSANTPLDD